jgi:hypothetical protein
VAPVKYSVAPEMIWEASVVRKALCHFLDCVVDSFGNSILRWCVHDIGFFMMNSLLNKICLEFGGFIFPSAICVNKVDSFSSDGFSSSDVGLKSIEGFIFGFLEVNHYKVRFAVCESRKVPVACV